MEYVLYVLECGACEECNVCGLWAGGALEGNCGYHSQCPFTAYEELLEVIPGLGVGGCGWVWVCVTWAQCWVYYGYVTTNTQCSHRRCCTLCAVIHPYTHTYNHNHLQSQTYPVLSLRSVESKSNTLPSANTTSTPNTLPCKLPYRSNRSPPALVATLPPI